MGAKDTKEKEYLSDNKKFADLCNLALFDGDEVITAQDLEERDSTEVLSILGINPKEVDYQQKWRDLLKGAVIKSTKQAVYVMIGVENQSDIHYAMPVKSMIYDALNYGSQVKEAARRHKKENDYVSNAEFLSGFSATDKLVPIIPITLYWGADEWKAPISLSQMFEKFDNETVEAINLFTGAKIKTEQKGGATDVCKAIEDMKREAVMETDMKSIKNLFENGCSLEVVIASFKGVSEEIIRKIYNEVQITT